MTNFTEMELNVKIIPCTRLQEVFEFVPCVQKECTFWVGSAANLHTSCVAVHREALRAYGVSLKECGQMALDCRRAIPDSETKLSFGPQNVRFSIDTGSLPDDQPLDPDAALVASVQDGNMQSFGELVLRHRRRIYRALMAILRNAEEAQDAMQDTFLKALVHIGDFQRRSKFSTWLITIANNIALQRLRDRKRLDLFGDVGDESELHTLQARTWDADPEQLYSQTERRKLVESGLMKMPSKYRTVLILRDIKQLSTEEAATALNLSIPALKARLFRARRMLREALSPYFTANFQGMDEDR